MPLHETVQNLTRADRGRYAIYDKELGSGGLARVREGFDKTLDIPVALKVFHKKIVGATNTQAEQIVRHEAEMQHCAHKSAPQHTPQLYRCVLNAKDPEQCDTLKKSFFSRRHILIMERLNGVSLYAKIKRNNEAVEHFGVDEVVEIATQIATALEQLHSDGLIHTDVKKENVVCGIGDDRGKSWIIDFGTMYRKNEWLRRTSEGSLIYPPESNENLYFADEKLDVWGIGMMIFEALCKRPLFEYVWRGLFNNDIIKSYWEDNKNGGFDRYLEAEIKNICAMGRPQRLLAEVIQGCLQIDPKKRIQSMKVVKKLLMSI